MEAQQKSYFESLKDSDPRFNLVGGTFKGAKTVRSNVHTFDLPD